MDARRNPFEHGRGDRSRKAELHEGGVVVVLEQRGVRCAAAREVERREPERPRGVHDDPIGGGDRARDGAKCGTRYVQVGRSDWEAADACVCDPGRIESRARCANDMHIERFREQLGRVERNQCDTVGIGWHGVGDDEEPFARTRRLHGLMFIDAERQRQSATGSIRQGSHVRGCATRRRERRLGEAEPTGRGEPNQREYDRNGEHHHHHERQRPKAINSRCLTARVRLSSIL